MWKGGEFSPPFRIRVLLSTETEEQKKRGRPGNEANDVGYHSLIGQMHLKPQPSQILVSLYPIRPKAEWTFGMKVSGEIGLFQADHVTTELDPVGELKEKVQSGKAKAADLPISQPTFVSHEYHWGFDGNKWASESSREQELIG